MWGKLLERSFPHAPFKNFPKRKFLGYQYWESLCAAAKFH